MAVNNEYVNRVDANGQTLIDLTNDTAEAEDVLEGQAFHLRSGAPAVGTYRPSDEIEARMRATVGHSSKNLLKIEADSQTINGVTFTVDKTAGTITANGTATQDARFSSIRFYLPTGNYYFLGCPNGGSDSTWDVYTLDYVTGGRCKMWNGIDDSPSDYDGTKKECRIVAEHLCGITLRIRGGQKVNNLVFKPMVWDGSISDDTFEPYVTPTDERIASLEAQAATSDEIEARLEATVGHSCKNILPITLSSGTYTEGGANLTYTVDKVAGTITLHGKSRTSGVIVLTVYEDSTGKISGDLYISGGGNENARLTGRDLTLNAGMMAWDGATASAASTGENDSQQIRPVAGHNNDFRYRILAGATFNYLVLKPMLRSGSISDDTFEPYVTPTDERIEPKVRAYLNSTVGHSSKNLLDISGQDSINYGVRWYEENGRLRAVGTYNDNAAHSQPRFYTKLKAGSYIFSGSPIYSETGVKILIGTCLDAQGTSFTALGYDEGNGFTFTLQSDSWVSIRMYTAKKLYQQSIDLTLPVMLRDGSISDDTFEPYVTPTDERIGDEIEARLRATVGHSCKNLLEITAETKTTNGVTFTSDIVNGTITAEGQTTNTSEGSQYNFQGDGLRVINNIESGMLMSLEVESTPTITSGAYLAIGYYNSQQNYISEQRCIISVGELALSIPSNAAYYRLFVRKTRTAGGTTVVYKPMLRDGSIKDGTFEPYVTPTDEKKQDKPVVLWEGDVTTNLTVNIGDNSYYSHYILTGISSVKTDRSGASEAPAIFTVIIYSDMPGCYCVPDYDIYAILTISYQSSQGVTNMVIDNPKNITLNKIIGIPK